MEIFWVYISYKILYSLPICKCLRVKFLDPPNTHNEVFVHSKKVARTGYLMALCFKDFSFSALPDILKIQTSQAFVCLPKEATALNIIRNVSL